MSREEGAAGDRRLFVTAERRSDRSRRRPMAAPVPRVAGGDRYRRRIGRRQPGLSTEVGGAVAAERDPRVTGGVGGPSRAARETGDRGGPPRLTAVERRRDEVVSCVEGARQILLPGRDDVARVRRIDRNRRLDLEIVDLVVVMEGAWTASSPRRCSSGQPRHSPGVSLPARQGTQLRPWPHICDGEWSNDPVK